MRPVVLGIVGFAGLAALGALGLSAYSGLPPETLVPLERGQTVVGLNVAVDLGEVRRPDVAGWFGVGLGGGIDAAVGLDVPLALVFGGLRAAELDRHGLLPGLAVRKTWASGVGVGVGMSTRMDFSVLDSLGPGRLSTAGAFVTAGPRPGSWDGDRWSGGRATASVGYVELEHGGVVRRGLAAHVSAQSGAVMASDDTTAVLVGPRAQAGVLLLPRLAVLHGPTVGLTAQVTELPEPCPGDRRGVAVRPSTARHQR